MVYMTIFSFYSELKNENENKNGKLFLTFPGGDSEQNNVLKMNISGKSKPICLHIENNKSL